MKSLRSRGYDVEKKADVSIEIQVTAGGKDLDWRKIRKLLRKIRRRYGNIDGTEYLVMFSSQDQQHQPLHN